jgi:sugar O-acyltransferase (sialic acid O-acetyltransferase NeuD family)
VTQPPSPGWLVFACRTSYAADLVEVIWRTGGEVRALVDNWTGEPLHDAVAEVIEAQAITEELAECPVVVAPTVPGHRFSAQRDAVERDLRSFPALIDPTSIVARTADIDDGATINAGVVIGARTALGEFVCVNRSASIAHDNTIHDFATIGPGCVLGGFVTVGRGAFLGVGAICAPEVSIGANATVGAGAVVIRDVAPNTVVVGNPAKALKVSDSGYGGVSVPV